MKTWNCAFTFGFSVSGCADKEGDTLTGHDIRQAILNRLDNISDDELLENVGMPFDAFEEKA